MPTNIAELVAQLPPTDKEARTKPGTPAASTFTGPDLDLLAKLVSQVLAGGQASIADLAKQVQDRASPDYKSYRAEYLLHAVVLAVGPPPQAAQRKLVVEALAGELANEKLSSYTRGLLIRELQWCGDESAASAIGKLLTDKQFCENAVATLVAIGGPACVEQLRAAYPKVEAQLRLPILHALGALRDVKSARLFRDVLAGDQADMHLTAAWASANIVDAEAALALLKLANAPTSFDRNQAAVACLRLIEGLATKDKAAAQALAQKLRETRIPTDEQVLIDAIDRLNL